MAGNVPQTPAGKAGVAVKSTEMPAASAPFCRTVAATALVLVPLATMVAGLALAVTV